MLLSIKISLTRADCVSMADRVSHIFLTQHNMVADLESEQPSSVSHLDAKREELMSRGLC